MVDDLRQQASELYKERSQVDALPTSDSHSMKKIVYLSLGLGILLLVVVYFLGGFTPRTDPVVAANTPPPLVKEAPPEELMKPEADTPAPAPPTEKPVHPVAESAPPIEDSPPADKPATEAGSESARKPEPPRERPRSVKPAGSGEPAVAPAVPHPEPPKLSDLEIARRELARNIVIEKNPSLAKLISGPNDKNWTAEPEGTDVYQVTFNVVDDATGSQAQYVWRVNLSDRSITPLSYYARKLS
jgi:hypothetical protein